ncbi:MAG: hypothetical protein RR740_00620 [Pseudomonas sp.]
MTSYTIDVTKDGEFLFRTAEQPGSSADPAVEKVVLELSSRFTKADGYSVIFIEWPDQKGVMSDVTQ